MAIQISTTHHFPFSVWIEFFHQLYWKPFTWTVKVNCFDISFSWPNFSHEISQLCSYISCFKPMTHLPPLPVLPFLVSLYPLPCLCIAQPAPYVKASVSRCAGHHNDSLESSTLRPPPHVGLLCFPRPNREAQTYIWTCSAETPEEQMRYQPLTLLTWPPQTQVFTHRSTCHHYALPQNPSSYLDNHRTWINTLIFLSEFKAYFKFPPWLKSTYPSAGLSIRILIQSQTSLCSPCIKSIASVRAPKDKQRPLQESAFTALYWKRNDKVTRWHDDTTTHHLHMKPHSYSVCLYLVAVLYIDNR